MSCVFLKISIFNWYNLNSKVTLYFEIFSRGIFISAMWCFFAIRGAPCRAADVSRVTEEWERLF